MKKKILFVCTVNRLRSKTAETILKQNNNYEVKSAGTSADAENILTKELLEWADSIFVMEKHHRNKIQSEFPEIYRTKSIECFHIPDDYEYMDPELIKILEQKFKRYFQ